VELEVEAERAFGLGHHRCRIPTRTQAWWGRPPSACVTTARPSQPGGHTRVINRNPDTWPSSASTAPAAIVAGGRPDDHDHGPARVRQRLVAELGAALVAERRAGHTRNDRRPGRAGPTRQWAGALARTAPPRGAGVVARAHLPCGSRCQTDVYAGPIDEAGISAWPARDPTRTAAPSRHSPRNARRCRREGPPSLRLPPTWQEHSSSHLRAVDDDPSHARDRVPLERRVGGRGRAAAPSALTTPRSDRHWSPAGR
jgi:hypothetical protein